MKTRFHKLTAWILTLAMLMTLLPGFTLSASAAEEYFLSIGPERLTGNNLTIEDDKGGTATYNPDQNTLTLNNFTYEGVGERGAAIFYNGGLDSTLNIVLVGESSVTYFIEGSQRGHGVYAIGSITVSGDGTLTANGNAFGDSYGVYVAIGSITVSGNCTVTANGSNSTNNSYGVYADGSITVSGNCTVTANGSNSTNSSYGVYAGSIIILGGSLTGTAGEAYDSCGVRTDSITISGGSLTGTSSEADISTGVSTFSITISGGSLTGTGSGATNSDGIEVVESITISGGEVVAKGSRFAFVQAPPHHQCNTHQCGSLVRRY